jgi:hypothetical protein
LICFDPLQVGLYVLAALGVLFLIVIGLGIARSRSRSAPGPDDLGGDQDE